MTTGRARALAMISSEDAGGGQRPSAGAAGAARRRCRRRSRFGRAAIADLGELHLGLGTLIAAVMTAWMRGR